MQQTYRYRNIIIKPHCMQFVINELHLLVLISVGFVYAGIDDAVLSTLVFVLSLLFSLCLAYRMVYLCRMRYIISNEQLVFEHGVFHREVDYQELYRVVDFNESQTFMQQLFRLKTVSIYSGDRTTPRLDIIGVPMKEELVTTIRKRVETSKRRRSIYMRLQIGKIWLIAIIGIATASEAKAQLVSSNPLEWMALAEGNELINSEIEKQINGQTKTAMLQNTMAAEFNQIHKWEKKYNSYLKSVNGYASSLKACTHLYDDGVKIFITLAKLKAAIANNPQGIVASMSMNNLYIETATELVSVFNLLNDAVANGGTENMLTGADRSKTLWALNDKLSAFQKKLNKLYLSIRYYTMSDVWNNVTAGMIDRSNGEIATQALGRWRRAAKVSTP